MELHSDSRPMGQMALFGSTDSLNQNIVFPGDSRWWEVMDRWIISYAIAYDCETRAMGRGKKDALNPWKNTPRLHQVGVQMEDKSVMTLMVDTDQAGGLRKVKQARLLFHLVNHDLLWVAYEPRFLQQVAFYVLLRYFAIHPQLWVFIQNGMFDCLCWRVWYGWRVRAIFDTFIASNLQWAGLPVKHSLGAQCDRYGLAIDKSEQTSDWGAPLLTAAQLNYASRDVEVLFPLVEKYSRYLTIQGQADVMWVEMRFLPALVEIEFNGLPVDVEKLIEYQAAYQAAYDTYFKEVNLVWKTHSPVIMGTVIMRSDLQVDSQEQVGQLVKDLTGKPSAKTDKQVLLALAETWPIFKTLSLCRTLKKSLDKFTAILKAKRRHPTGHWVVSGAYKQFSKSAGDDDAGTDDVGAGTGRTGSGSGSRGAYLAPNLQNIPTQDKLPAEIAVLGLRSIRECFCIPAAANFGLAGCLYVHDLAAAHARIAAALSGDRLMREIYESDVDAHALTVVALIKYLDNYDPVTMAVTPEDVAQAMLDKKEGRPLTDLQKLLISLRGVGKNFYYSCLNDGGVFVLYRLFQSSYLLISLENCERALEEYFRLYSGLGYFLDNTRSQCQLPPIEFPEGVKTLANRTARSKWIRFNNAWYYQVQYKPEGLMARRTNRKVRIKAMKAGGCIAVGPKPADVLSATWLGMEATIMKKAAGLLYEWLVEHPEIPFYMGGIVHDELDGWSLTPQLAAAEQLVNCMDRCMAEMVDPIPPGPETKPIKTIVYTWNEK